MGGALEEGVGGALEEGVGGALEEGVGGGRAKNALVHHCGAAVPSNWAFDD